MEQFVRSMRPQHEALTQLATTLSPIRTHAQHLAHVTRPYAEFARSLQESLAPMRRLADQVNAAMRPYNELTKQLAEMTKPFASLLEQYNNALKPLFDSGWLKAVNEGFKQFGEALANAEAMGRCGWTVPLNADVGECIRLLRAAHDPESADRAFVAFYSDHEGARFAELLVDLLNRPELVEWHPLLEEVIFAIDAGKYRVAIPALLCTFEGVAQRAWTKQFDNGPGRAAFFDRKLKGLAPDAFQRPLWSSMKAFVGELYVQARETKPVSLNRHWILHGREPAAGNFADCLRLLQAIHTAVTLVEHERVGPERPVTAQAAAEHLG